MVDERKSYDGKFYEKEYLLYLKNNNLSQNTIDSYLYKLRMFFLKYKKMTKDNLLLEKGKLIEQNRSSKAINNFICAMTSYIKFLYNEMDFTESIKLKLKQIKQQHITFLENVITLQQYKQLCDFLKKNINKEIEGKVIYNIDKNRKNSRGGILMIGNSKTSYRKVYIAIRCLGLTGVRISELLQFNTQAVEMGYFDVCGKGNKVRRIYIPKKLQIELQEWIKDENKQGFLFINKLGEKISSRWLAHSLKDYAKMAGIPERVVYPHSFRHMFAKAFLARRQDISLLSDLLGHSNIETTRIYLRLSSEEQKEIVDKVVDW